MIDLKLAFSLSVRRSFIYSGHESFMTRGMRKLGVGSWSTNIISLLIRSVQQSSYSSVAFLGGCFLDRANGHRLMAHCWARFGWCLMADDIARLKSHVIMGVVGRLAQDLKSC